jgi:hypothetical protein
MTVYYFIFTNGIFTKSYFPNNPTNDNVNHKYNNSNHKLLFRRFNWNLNKLHSFMLKIPSIRGKINYIPDHPIIYIYAQIPS